MSTRAQRAELVSKPPKNLGEFAASTKTQTAARARKQSGKLNETFAAKLPAAACCLLLPAAACCLLLPAAACCWCCCWWLLLLLLCCCNQTASKARSSYCCCCCAHKDTALPDGETPWRWRTNGVQNRRFPGPERPFWNLLEKACYTFLDAGYWELLLLLLLQVEVVVVVIAGQYLFFPYALPLASAGVGGFWLRRLALAVRRTLLHRKVYFYRHHVCFWS